MPSEELFDGTADGYRAEFLFAVEAARALHDPVTEWSSFRDALWVYLARVFGVDAAEGWPEGLPDPASGPGGDARVVASWLCGQDDQAQRSAAMPRR